MKSSELKLLLHFSYLSNIAYESKFYSSLLDMNPN